MSEYAVETRSTIPKHFFAGEFPTVTETGIAGADVAEYAPVTIDGEGKIVPIAAETKDAVIGIAAAAAAKKEPVVYYMTGEFFADAINLPEEVNIAEVKAACRKISIFLK